MNKLRRLVLVGLLIPFHQHLSARELTAPELSDFSLEGLMQVSVASKTNRSFKDIPSTVYVYTDEDIKRHGWMYLSEIIRDVPGVDMSDAGSGSFFSTQGVADSSAHGNKTIILFNGHNIGFPSTNSANFLGLQKDINLASIKKVEVLVGPGSTLHGANAFGMVVNLISHDPEDISGIKANFSYGSNQESISSLTGSFGKGNISGLLSGSFFDQRRVNLSEVPISSTANMEKYDNSKFEDNFHKNYAVDGYIDYDRQLRFGFNVMHNDSGHGTLFLSTDVGRRVFDKKMFFADVNRKITQSVEYKLRSNYFIANADSEKIQQEFTGSSNTHSSTNVGAESITLDNQVIYSLNEKNTTLVGLFAERTRQRPVSGSTTATGIPVPAPDAKPAQNWDNYAVYLQWEWKPIKEFFSVAGIRYVESIKHYDAISLPHIGFNYSITPQLLAKFNYQKGYRPPSVFEVGSVAVFLRPNPDLEPEIIDTYQVSLISKLEQKYEFHITAFYSEVFNLIKRVTTGDLVAGTTNPIFTDENIAQNYIEGIQVGINAELTESLFLKSYATYTDSRDSIAKYDTETVVPYKLNLSVDWRIYAGWSLMLDNYWRVHPTTGKNNTVYQGQDAPDWLLINASLRKEDLFAIQDLSMNFTIRNLLDKEYSMIDRRGGAAVVPGAHPGDLLNALLSLEYQFL